VDRANYGRMARLPGVEIVEVARRR
jgi:hypothetical protein